ncbi:MAG: TAT-variant-translocated molybdopterin oxidoreductase [Planctomycetes bacterium]|nr:TAT-variant-translocated molybdopterin oxidoreductase [Planctomycetota bacterium]
MACDTLIPATPAPEATAQELWRSAEELTTTAEFREMISREFPDDIETWTDPVSRRQFLTLMSASIALAGFSGCSPRPASQQKILPYTKQPEGLTLGVPDFFASASVVGGIATGIIVTSREGRPIKVEGNPLHPGSLGGTDVFAQALVLGLCDPDRSQSLVHLGASRTWEEAISFFRGELDKLKARKANIRLLTETVTSPTLKVQIDKFTAKTGAKWVQYEPATLDNVRAGNQQAFDAPVTVIHDFTKANVILALDSDFLTSGPGNVRYARDFGSRRRVRGNHADGGTPSEMNRLYSVEAMLTPTGSVADHRLPLKASEVGSFARALAAQLKVPGAPSAGPLSENAKAWLAPLAADLEKNRGKCVVIAGENQPPAVQALVHAINAALGNLGQTVHVIKSIEAQPENQLKNFTELVGEMNAGKVDLLFILGGNPVFDAPADLKFTDALDKVGLRVHMGLYQDETAARCHWHFPEAHSLETWGDARGYDGTATIIQPLIAPLYNAKSFVEVLSALSADAVESGQSGRDIVKSFWKKWYDEHNKEKKAGFAEFWFNSVWNGVVAGTAREAPEKKDLAPGWAGKDAVSSSSGIEVCFRADPTIHDGRFANIGWLQELPKPVSKLCWDNAAIMSPKTAEKLGLSILPRWTAGERGRMEAGAGRVGNGTGYNTYKLRGTDAPSTATGVEIKKVDDVINLACTQAHHAMEGRKPIRRLTLDQMADKKAFDLEMSPPVAAGEKDLIRDNLPGPLERTEKAKHPNEHHHGHDHEEHHHEHDKRLVPLTMYPDTNKEGRRWAMAIDLTSCIGCNVCMIACMAENNIPVIGKFEVSRGREMYWIRVDRYHEGDPMVAEGLKTYFQPVPCQQCEKAPCEVVCPVGATVHSTDGLNDMVYNRCVGTRYCSNNCPYKVRRFNFLTYADYVTESLKIGRNPEVSVRTRGVMEKCTYCVQRIRSAEIVAEREFRPIADGEIVTACQAACPTGAIVFGDLADTKSVVRRWKAEKTNYGLLAELNTMPRTSYLAAVRNPNSAMPKGA